MIFNRFSVTEGHKTRKEWEECKDVSEMLLYVIEKKPVVWYFYHVFLKIGGSIGFSHDRVLFLGDFLNNRVPRRKFKETLERVKVIPNQVDLVDSLINITFNKECWIDKKVIESIKNQPLWNYPEILREVVNPFHVRMFFDKETHKFSYFVRNNRIYEEDYLILHDMLIDKGCEDEELLNHLKEKNHLPGCWALERLIPKWRFPCYA